MTVLRHSSEEILCKTSKNISFTPDIPLITLRIIKDQLDKSAASAFNKGDLLYFQDFPNNPSRMEVIKKIHQSLPQVIEADKSEQFLLEIVEGAPFLFLNWGIYSSFRSFEDRIKKYPKNLAVFGMVMFYQNQHLFLSNAQIFAEYNTSWEKPFIDLTLPYIKKANENV